MPDLAYKRITDNKSYQVMNSLEEPPPYRSYGIARGFVDVQPTNTASCSVSDTGTADIRVKIGLSADWGHHRKRNKSYAKLMPSNLVALITFRQAAVCAMPMRSLNMGCRLAARCKRLRQAVKNAAVSSLPRLATPLTQVF